VVDSPVEHPNGQYPSTAASPSGGRVTPRRDEPGATEPQVRAIYSIARGGWSLGEEEIENRCKEMYGVLPSELSRRQASELIDSLKRAAT
jgi:hypothetical protein